MTRNALTIEPTGLWRGAALVVAAAAIAALLFAAPTVFRSAEKAPPRSAIAGLVEQQAQHLNRRAPLRVDAARTMIGVSAEDNRLVYRMRLSEDVPAADVASAQARLQAADAAELCAGTTTRAMIDRGAVFERRYADPGGDAFRTEVGACAGEQGKSSLPMAM